MNIAVTIRLTDGRVELRSADANLREDRPFTHADAASLTEWSDRYRKTESPEDLLRIGQELYAWVNGADKFLERMIDSVAAPVIIEFAAGREESEHVRAFLDAPWELLADDGRHWALREDMVFTPIRRIGKASKPPEAPSHRLGLVFMAAAPRNVSPLDYEAEEASILQATKNIGLDLVVEESGTLELLAACVAREKPDVVQISCHGTLEPSPALVLEDDEGNPHFVKTQALLSKLANSDVRLYFLSACETAEAHPVLDSLARSLVRAGAPAVLGWAGPVLDREATLFASYLHRRLLAGEELARALARTRHELAHSEALPDPGHPGPRAEDWHLARLYLGPNGGGALATANGPRRFVGRGHAIKTFLDAKGKQVPVAGELEFVGRRREIQTVLREFRAPDSERQGGVLIHGMGRQGKSSLAARVAHRMEPTHDTVVVYGRYDAPAILAAFRDRIGTPAVTEIVDRYLTRTDSEPTALLPALTELLEGPCKQAPDRPLLLVIDDFEQTLEEQAGGPHSLKHQVVDSIRAVLLAFSAAATESRLLITSRFRFTLPHQGKDLADLLLDLSLRGMNEREAHKQAFAKLGLATGKTRQTKHFGALLERLDRIITASRGNAGLQDVLYSLCLEDSQACDRCLDQMEEYGRTGNVPEEDKVRAFLENLAIQGLLELLTPEQHELLGALTLFELPVPPSVMKSVTVSKTAEHDLQRLIDVGLLEIYEDLYEPLDPALAINEMVRPLAGEMEQDAEKRLAHTSCPVLFNAWGGEARGDSRGFIQDYELTRLGLLAGDTHVLANCGAGALRFLEKAFAYREAAEWAGQIMAVIDAAKAPAPVALLRTAAERLMTIGEVTAARMLRVRALAEVEKGVAVSDSVRGLLALEHARALVQEGLTEEALHYFDQARELAPSRREEAIVGGEIARIRFAKGDLDEALSLQIEQLAIFEELGDQRERAITLGDVAYIRAAKGDLDEALSLHNERLVIFEKFGDKRERSVALGDIARIHIAKRNLADALSLLNEQLAIVEEIGDLEGIANAMWSMARIELQQKEYEEAYKHLTRSYEISVELERLDAICHIGLDLGQFLYVAGQKDKGKDILLRSRDGLLKLGRTDWAKQVQDLLDQLQ